MRDGPGVGADRTSGGSADPVEIERPHAGFLARPEARSWIETAPERHETLHRAASRSKDAIRMEGRGPAPGEVEALAKGPGR